LGRYLELRQFLEFMNSDVLDHPSVYLEMSSASLVEVYQRILREERLWNRLLFGSDLPFGLITGVEYWSSESGPVFITRHDYAWSDPAVQQRFAEQRRTLTYNTYHVIKSLKDALESLGLSGKTAEKLKRRIFSENARALLPG
jgi:predicted TIM-barrel fold metal-dependent hydrolase